MQGMWIWSLGWEDPLEEAMVIHSSILAWKVPWTEESGGLQSMGSQTQGWAWAGADRFLGLGHRHLWGNQYSAYHNSHGRLDNYIQIFEGLTMWKLEEGSGFFCVVPGDRIRTCGWKLQRDRFVPTVRELCNRAVRMEWAVSESNMSQTLAVLNRRWEISNRSCYR